MKKFARFFLIGLVSPSIVTVIAVMIGLEGTALNVVISICFIFFFIVFMAYIYRPNSSNKKYKKMYIYDWMDDPDNDYEHLLTILKSSPAAYKTIDNLKSIKKIIFKQANGEIESLKLYKAFYNQVSKETMEELYFKTALVISSSLAVFVLRDYVSGIGTGSKTVGFVIFFAFLINVAFISQKIVGNKKRIGLLTEILDICIEEIEEKDKEKKG